MRRRGRGRPLMRAAMVGGTAYVAGKAGANSVNRQNEEAQQADMQEQRLEDLEAAQMQAPPMAAPAAAPAPSGGGGMSSEAMEKLQSLAGLRDQGILTDAEFQVQKQMILQGL